jgi:[ribosomal protein S5]-alanine N-acetyltransferase
MSQQSAIAQLPTDQMYQRYADLLVRNARPSDAEMIADYFVANREHLKPWEPVREEVFYTQQAWFQRLLKLKELHAHALGYYLIIMDIPTNAMIGTISFSQLTRFPFYACSVGYSLAQEWQGRGVMPTALGIACRFMFEKQNIHRIMAAYMPRNSRSSSVLKKLGFVHEGLAKEYLLIDGTWEDHHLTSLINHNWSDSL